MTKLVLLADDNKGMRQALRMLFESELDFEVVGEAKHGQEAIEKGEMLKPHLIILDFSMPVMNGLEAAPILRKKLPSVILILFSNYVSEAMEAPARAGWHPRHRSQASGIDAPDAYRPRSFCGSHTSARRPICS